MKIVGEQLVLPRNFEFFRRLPSRFEILVIGKGAIRAEGSTFEIEIMGQRLTLRSKVDLKAGARYELEKQSATEFRIARELVHEKAQPQQTAADKPPSLKNESVHDPHLLFAAGDVSAQDLWKIHTLADSTPRIEQRENKYLFDLEASAGIKGLFVPVSSGGHALLLCGTAASNENLNALRGMLSDLQIRSVARVDAATFERIATGAIDFSG
jgi:hypothetical protein